MANRKRKSENEFLAGAGRQWESLKHVMSKDFRMSTGSDGKSKFWTCIFYRFMFVMWIVAVLAIIPMIVLWTPLAAAVTVQAKMFSTVAILVFWLLSAGSMYVTMHPKFNGR